MSKAFEKSIEAINTAGILLVFPVKNAKEPRSVWSALYPRSQMIWDWDDSGSKKVHDLWFMMKELSACRRVVYSKWYQGRATFFSRDLFKALLRVHCFDKNGQLIALGNRLENSEALTYAKQILEALQMDSPLSTRELKRITELQGRMYEGVFNRAMKILFQSFQMVGFGEVDDGAFPSLAVGATQLLYEDLWQEGALTPLEKATDLIQKKLPADSKFGRFYRKTYEIHL